MDIEQYTTWVENMGSNSYRMFVKRNGISFSIVIGQVGRKPTHEEITDFFNKNHKHFCIEAEILEFKKI